MHIASKIQVRGEGKSQDEFSLCADRMLKNCIKSAEFMQKWVLSDVGSVMHDVLFTFRHTGIPLPPHDIYLHDAKR